MHNFHNFDNIIMPSNFTPWPLFLSTIKPVFISPGKKIEKEITFLHSFATEEICSASLVVVENVQLLSDLSLIGRKNEELNFLRRRNYSPAATKCVSGKTSGFREFQITWLYIYKYTIKLFSALISLRWNSHRVMSTLPPRRCWS